LQDDEGVSGNAQVSVFSELVRLAKVYAETPEVNSLCPRMARILEAITDKPMTLKQLRVALPDIKHHQPYLSLLAARNLIYKEGMCGSYVYHATEKAGADAV
jgi:hypothetical protein